MSFLLCRFPPWISGGTNETPLLLGFLDDGNIYAKGGSREWPKGSRQPPGAALVGATPGGRLGTWWPPSGSFLAKLRYSSGKYPPSIFSAFGDVLFQQLN